MDRGINSVFGMPSLPPGGGPRSMPRELLSRRRWGHTARAPLPIESTSFGLEARRVAHTWPSQAGGRSAGTSQPQISFPRVTGGKSPLFGMKAFVGINAYESISFFPLFFLSVFHTQTLSLFRSLYPSLSLTISLYANWVVNTQFTSCLDTWRRQNKRATWPVAAVGTRRRRSEAGWRSACMWLGGSCPGRRNTGGNWIRWNMFVEEDYSSPWLERTGCWTNTLPRELMMSPRLLLRLAFFSKGLAQINSPSVLDLQHRTHSENNRLDMLTDLTTM